jgi:hypothetical protein
MLIRSLICRIAPKHHHTCVESSLVAIFSAGDARERAIRYADREYGAFDEIELEPYQRSA